MQLEFSFNTQNWGLNHSILVFVFFFIFLMFIYFWERETDRQTEHEWGRGRERGRHRNRGRLQALSCQHRAWREAWTHKQWDHDLSRSRMLNQLSHPGNSVAFLILFLLTWFLAYFDWGDRKDWNNELLFKIIVRTLQNTYFFLLCVHFHDTSLSILLFGSQSEIILNEIIYL